jgi:GT2 family glycosyltransferase
MISQPECVIPVSVIVVSRARGAELRLCLMALTQQDHPSFEVIVVADPEGLAEAAYAEAGGMPLKKVAFDEANISAARNAGLAQAAGEVVAFIDDDAVAEPSWLSRLSAPFTDPSVVAATGFVRDRNGISLQWGAAWIDRFGVDHPIEIADAGGVFDAEADRAIKTQGTNCAFRRDALLAIGGFDPAYRFFHDETDVNLRLRARTAVVPLAQVVHGFAASAQRTGERVPKTLWDIGASTAIFLRRHAGQADLSRAKAALFAEQGQRLAKHRHAGRIKLQNEAELLKGLADGWHDGMERALGPLAPSPLATANFLPLPQPGLRKGVVISARPRHAAQARTDAKRAVAEGRIVTLICLSLSAQPHRLQFDPAGFWLHQGGIFGRSLREGPRFRLSRLHWRVAQERLRWAKFRPVD